MNLEQTINRLTYLRDNSANPEDRESLDIAIKHINSLKRNEKFKAISKALHELDAKDPNFVEKNQIITADLDYPEHEWISCTLEELLNRISEKEPSENCTKFFFNNKRLKEFVRVLEDDGMGYGAFNSYVFTGYPSDNEIQIWI